MSKADEMFKISKKAKKEEDKIVKSELKRMDALKDKILYEIEQCVQSVQKEAYTGFTQVSIPICKIPTLEDYIYNSKIIIILIIEKLRNWLIKEGFRVYFTIRPSNGMLEKINIYWGDGTTNE